LPAITRQCDAPLFKMLQNYAGKRAANFHVPGHKQGRGLPVELSSLGGQALFALDLTEIPELDDLHNPRGVIARAQELAARAYGAAKSFFLVNGTTAGVHALLLAVGGRGKVIVPRNAHRSVMGGLILSGADPEYVTPWTIKEFGIAGGVSPGQVRRALEANPGAGAVLAVRPNYYGVADELAGQVRAAHDAGKPLLVDEAHGAHLRFHPGLPGDAMAAGADASVQSTHKMGGSLTQSALLHLSGGLLDAGAVAGALDLLQTTSPSYILMASLDLARRQLVLTGQELLEKTLRLANETRKRLAGVSGLKVLAEEHLSGGSRALDLTKLVVSVDGLGLTGYQVGELLFSRYNIAIEMADLVNIVAFLSTGTTQAECDALVFALRDIARRDRLAAAPVSLPEIPACPVKRMKPRDAWFASARRVAPAEARGRICAEMVAVYPPGIPVLCPGEEITPAVYEYLAAVVKLGLTCQGLSGRTLKSIKVVVE